MLNRGLRWAKNLAISLTQQRPKLVADLNASVQNTQNPTSAQTTPEGITFRSAQGTHEGWLRVLSAPALIELVQGERAVREMRKQSRLSTMTWQRDLLPALERYAEFVQLMPASEAHHHAHAGGLLAHTLEMVLVAMTWRNGHFLPEGAPVEDMDAQRDEWTYVVFFAALLHDIAKIMTDLKVTWRCRGMDVPLHWVPISGTLSQIVGSRLDAQYLVEFTPKAARDYAAHSRMALMLLQQVAPTTAMTFLAQNPGALQTLTQYLSAQDRNSLVGKIVQKADQASTQRALLVGSKARFTTSTSVPLVDLLMSAISSMLKAGGTLPLNRSGAAGWVFDDSVWFVAKRLADAVRAHIRKHAPDEAIPGDNKNDRLFDTWQEYGCILANPQTGQSIWYVTVHGSGPSTDTDGVPQPESGNGSYVHSLSMLRFPLNKLFTEPTLYPAVMSGHIEIRARPVKDGDGEVSPSDGAVELADTPDPVVTDPLKPDGAAELCSGPRTQSLPPAPPEKPLHQKPKPGMALKAPAFNPPKQAQPKAASGPVQNSVTGMVQAPATPKSTKSAVPVAAGKWPEFEDDSIFNSPPGKPVTDAHVTVADVEQNLPPVVVARTVAPAKQPPKNEAAVVARPLLTQSTVVGNGAVPAATARALRQAPVVLTPFLPDLPHELAIEQHEPSAVAIGFITWLQQGLAQRRLKYNETGAVVHFVAEGMALVSPAIFKQYCAETQPDADAAAQGLQTQREVIKAGWHQIGPGKINILSYQVIGRGGAMVSKLSAVVLLNPDRWVMPVPPPNPVLKLVVPGSAT